MDMEALKMALAKMAGRNPEEDMQEEPLEGTPEEESSPEEERPESPTKGLDLKTLMMLLDAIKNKEMGGEQEAEESPAEEQQESPEEESAEPMEMASNEAPSKLDPEELKKMLEMFGQG